MAPIKCSECGSEYLEEFNICKACGKPMADAPDSNDSINSGDFKLYDSLVLDSQTVAGAAQVSEDEINSTDMEIVLVARKRSDRSKRNIRSSIVVILFFVLAVSAGAAVFIYVDSLKEAALEKNKLTQTTVTEKNTEAQNPNEGKEPEMTQSAIGSELEQFADLPDADKINTINEYYNRSGILMYAEAGTFLETSQTGTTPSEFANPVSGTYIEFDDSESIHIHTDFTNQLDLLQLELEYHSYSVAACIEAMDCQPNELDIEDQIYSFYAELVQEAMDSPGDVVQGEYADLSVEVRCEMGVSSKDIVLQKLDSQVSARPVDRQ